MEQAGLELVRQGDKSGTIGKVSDENWERKERELEKRRGCELGENGRNNDVQGTRALLHGVKPLLVSGYEHITQL